MLCISSLSGDELECDDLGVLQHRTIPEDGASNRRAKTVLLLLHLPCVS